MSTQPLVFITGCNGFTGVHLTRYLLSLQVQVVGIGRRPTPLLQDERFTYENCDMGNPVEIKKTLQNYQPHYVVHLAAETDVPSSWIDPAKILRANTLHTFHLLEAIRTQPQQHLKKVLLIGSAQEYQAESPSSEVRLSEKSVVLPSNPYGWSKLLQTYLGLMYARTFGIPLVIARPFNLIGPGTMNGVCAQLGKQIVEMELGMKPLALSVGNVRNERDFLDIRDAIRAYWTLLVCESIRSTDIYNVCSDVATSIYDIVTHFQSLSRTPFEVKIDPSLIRNQDVASLCGSSQKLRTSTGWQPKITLKTSLTDIITHFRNEYTKEERDI